MQTLTFTLPNQTSTSVTVTRLLNAGYAGRNQQEVQDHIDELAELGIPGPTTIPALYPVAPYLAMQTNLVPVQHDQTSGEAEWALVVTEDDVLLTVACDHTDRKLEVHGVAWSKNASPDVLGADAWSLTEIRDHLDSIRLRGWVGEGENEELIQDSPLAALLSPDHWLAVLTERGLNEPGTILLSGTIQMVKGVNQFATAWRVELYDPVLNRRIGAAYSVERMPEPIG
ncbi:DUF2848 domain-containing protein [Lysinibacter cavernae]|uniref:DUF2848 domain-containing protein n=1 Tax=Lysinibacter cavernae TaxID=1640652 RepID=A0A7X5QZM1_9MICO|nr:DUF2848 domain-containing protein [Lysinibacter cavernae]NIH52712.1 hypothetical protein [Lysinibacter cavernae]